MDPSLIVAMTTASCIKGFAVLEIKAKQDLGSPSAGNISGEAYLFVREKKTKIKA